MSSTRQPEQLKASHKLLSVCIFFYDVSNITSEFFNFVPLAVDDYVSTVQNISFGPGRNEMVVPVPTLADNILEFNETFFGNLRFPSGVPGSVRLFPIRAEGTIIDDSTVEIGFLSDEMVIEGTNNTVMLELVVTSGILGRQVVISVSTVDDSATGKTQIG